MSNINSPKKGDVVELQKQNVTVENCINCEKLMVNIDASQIAEGDLVTLKRLGVLVSNPEIINPICIGCEVRNNAYRLVEWFEKPAKARNNNKDKDDNDSSFFSGGGLFGGGGFGGGFGGGGFGGAGASRGF